MTKTRKGWCMNRTLFKKKDNNKGGEASVPNGAKMTAFEFMLKTWSLFPCKVHLPCPSTPQLRRGLFSQLSDPCRRMPRANNTLVTRQWCLIKKVQLLVFVCLLVFLSLRLLDSLCLLGTNTDERGTNR